MLGKAKEKAEGARNSALVAKDALEAAAAEKMRELEASASSSWSHAEATVKHDLAEFEGSVVAGAKRAGGALKDEALDSSEFESTISRRNILLTVADGDVDRALDAVARQYLMTGRLSKLAASSLPVIPQSDRRARVLYGYEY